MKRKILTVECGCIAGYSEACKHVLALLHFMKNILTSGKNKVRDITKLSGYPRSNDKTRLEQSNYSLASGRFPLQNAIYDNKLPFSRM